ncbi:IS66 family insertion sequence element accessory protein TnpA [Paenibacillus alginolyticus]|uniref:IS66 family insertion sequence element accessory protein TnpB n=1 Tax=Paenibacillus alginolyticus TaxID=59839 RepID=A0ABT4G5L9_9BACL|nr:IS66 family insertion sequence element accessory protein TnpB [Paenibacillus alginolyticus]MCY9691478.1 IS66 family insertion sequence element accessory protein TnpB [Paenibacillus alginolyticus]MEC0146588.1 IS66 family insertion sequence element accessory protein TnpB [Paenibacillus alginolyticus]
MNKQQRLQEWTTRIIDFKSSGLTMSAWCQAHGQTIHQLKYWLRKLNESSSSATSSSNWLPLAIHSPSAEFSTPSSSLTVRVGHLAIEVQAGFNPNLLQEIVRALDLSC